MVSPPVSAKDAEKAGSSGLVPHPAVRAVNDSPQNRARAARAKCFILYPSFRIPTSGNRGLSFRIFYHLFHHNKSDFFARKAWDDKDMKRAAALSVFCLVAALLLTGCGEEDSASSPEPRRFTTTFVRMDTAVNFTAYCNTSGDFDRAVQIVSDTLAEAEGLYDRYAEDSALSALNRAGGAFVEVPQSLAALLASCQEWGQTVAGVNLAMGKVTDLWQAARQTGILPDESAVREALACAQNAGLEWSDAGIRLTEPYASLDLGCVAKGAAADQAADRLDAAGFTTYLLDCGTSSILCAGAPPGQEGWTVALVNPDSRLNLSGAVSPDPTLGVLVLHDTALGVSGDYQRYGIFGGEVYAHVLDPETGYPARFVRQVCVLADSAARADYLSTALFAQPFELAWQTAQNLSGAAGLFVLPDGSLRMTGEFPLRAA